MSHEANEDRADAILPPSEILRQHAQEFGSSLPKEDVLTSARPLTNSETVWYPISSAPQTKNYTGPAHRRSNESSHISLNWHLSNVCSMCTQGLDLPDLVMKRSSIIAVGVLSGVSIQYSEH
ncbi:hypothetical protein ARMSODRAFT_978736 [Armillaria solidipes]|uniref:Uncharacterized protein n=1 Tax=Armillaria solidipes TaxID=1076256 RepID=A0A2H3BCL0_9AGAR|nr:hypothetical protein ARMSODRAFT_978736 [Armillaria solidipes]